MSFNCALLENTWLVASRDSDENGERIRLAGRKCDKHAEISSVIRHPSPAIQLRPIKTGKERMRADVVGSSGSDRGAVEHLKHIMARKIAVAIMMCMIQCSSEQQQKQKKQDRWRHSHRSSCKHTRQRTIVTAAMLHAQTCRLIAALGPCDTAALSDQQPRANY